MTDDRFERLQRLAEQYAIERDAFEAKDRKINELRARIAELEEELNGWHKSQSRFYDKLHARIAELEAALKPFADVPRYGEFGGPLVQARVYYECEPNDRCGVVHIDKNAFRAARAAYLGEKND